MLKKIGIGCGVIVGLFILLIVVVAIASPGSGKATPTAGVQASIPQGTAGSSTPIMAPLAEATLPPTTTVPQQTATPAPPKATPTPRPPDYQLELLSMTDSREYGYITVEGQVKNVSGAPLKNVEAVVQFYTADGTFVKSAEALVEYNPILPDQTSPFRAGTTDNPSIAKFETSFKYLIGGTISTHDSRKSK